MPWDSKAQARWGHTKRGMRALGGAAVVAEYDAATDWDHLPERTRSRMHRTLRTLRRHRRRSH